MTKKLNHAKSTLNLKNDVTHATELKTNEQNQIKGIVTSYGHIEFQINLHMVQVHLKMKTLFHAIVF